MQASYTRIIEDLAKAENIRLKWESYFPDPSTRKDAAEQIKEYLIRHFAVKLQGELIFEKDFTDNRRYIKLTKYIKGVSLEQSKKLYSFFFEPIRVVKTYAYH